MGGDGPKIVSKRVSLAQILSSPPILWGGHEKKIADFDVTPHREGGLKIFLSPKMRGVKTKFPPSPSESEGGGNQIPPPPFRKGGGNRPFPPPGGGLVPGGSFRFSEFSLTPLPGTGHSLLHKAKYPLPREARSRKVSGHSLFWGSLVFSFSDWTRLGRSRPESVQCGKTQERIPAVNNDSRGCVFSDTSTPEQPLPIT